MTRNLDLPLALTNMQGITASGGIAADTFIVSPDAGVTFHVNGGQPNGPLGDTLWLGPAGQIGPVLALTGHDATGLSGNWTFTNRQPVFFAGIDTLANLGNRLELPLLVK